MKRTYQPKKRHRKMEHGFRKEWRPGTAARFWPADVRKAENSSPIDVGRLPNPGSRRLWSAATAPRWS